MVQEGSGHPDPGTGILKLECCRLGRQREWPTWCNCQWRQVQQPILFSQGFSADLAMLCNAAHAAGRSLREREGARCRVALFSRILASPA